MTEPDTALGRATPDFVPLPELIAAHAARQADTTALDLR